METSAKGIYGIGDVAGPPMLAHKGKREGMIVAEVIAGKKFHPLNHGNVPNATYCHPEVASIIRTTVGLRPHRDSGFLLKAERFDHKTVIHNFGRGGAGMSLSWRTGALATPRQRARAEATEPFTPRLLPDTVQIGDIVLGPGEHPFSNGYATERPIMRFEPAIYLDALMRDVVAFGGRIVIRTFDTPAT